MQLAEEKGAEKAPLTLLPSILSCREALPVRVTNGPIRRMLRPSLQETSDCSGSLCPSRQAVHGKQPAPAVSIRHQVGSISFKPEACSTPSTLHTSHVNAPCPAPASAVSKANLILLLMPGEPAGALCHRQARCHSP